MLAGAFCRGRGVTSYAWPGADPEGGGAGVLGGPDPPFLAHVIGFLTLGTN